MPLGMLMPRTRPEKRGVCGRKSGWQSFWRGNHKFMQRISGLGANLCAITWAFCGCTYEICMQFWICHSFKCFLDYILGSSRSSSSYNTATTTAKGAQIIPGNVIIVFVCLPLLSLSLSVCVCAVKFAKAAAFKWATMPWGMQHRTERNTQQSKAKQTMPLAAGQHGNDTCIELMQS